MTIIPDPAVQDLLSMLGEPVGSGVDRAVFHWPFEINGYPAVVKVTTGAYDFQNVAEWHLWQAASDHLRPHLAPVLAVSPRGTLLWMVRCEPCPSHLIPSKMPAVLRDLHRNNIGLFQGRPVALDYGRHVAAQMASNAKAMRNLDKATSS